MPFVSQKNQRERMQTLTPFDQTVVPEFSETFNASLGMVIDEGLSSSGMMNREGLQDRNKQINAMIQSGAESADPFTDARGRFSYNDFAENKKIPGIKTNKELNEERNKILADRRTYANDVIERGSGMAQFLGAANGYMLDPINVASMGLSGAVVGAKSLSVMGRALMTAKNTAAIGAVSELAIQPLVYIHKQDIESPYAATDAITAIATTALGAGLLGGVAGGISGYLGRARKAVIDSGEITPEVEAALESLGRMEEAIALDRSTRANSDIVMADYDKLLSGDHDSFVKAAANSVKELEKEIIQVSKKSKTVKQLIQDSGGINRKVAANEGIDPADFKGGGSKPLFIKNGGKTFDGIAEILNESGYGGGRTLTANDALGIVNKVVRGEELFLDGAVKGDLDFLNRQLDELSRNDADEEFLESFYKGARVDDIESDASYLRQMEERRAQANQTSTTAEDYFEPERPKAPSAKTTPRESEIIRANETAENFNQDMKAYTDLSDVQKAEVSEAMAKFDDELEGLESVLVCAIA